MKKPLLIVGCGGHARSIVDVIESNGDWSIYGYVGLESEVGRKVLGYPVVGSDTSLSLLKQYCDHAVVAVGQLTSSALRQKLVLSLQKYDFCFPTIVSSFAHVSRHAKIGEGTTIMHGAIVNSSATIGRHCIINTRAVVDHDCRIDDFCHISTGVLLNGSVSIGSHSFVGSGAMVREGLSLPSQVIIGASQRVMGWPLISSPK